MSNTEFEPTTPKSIALWLILLVIVVATASAIWFLKPQPTNTVAAAIPTTTPATPTALSATQVNNIVSQQTSAISAAAHETHSQPIVGKIDQRPDFISEVEWQTLQIIAKKASNPDQELTRLVSNMRFNKQLEIWQSLVKTDAATDRAQRDTLATQLLNDIPTAVTNLAIDQVEAQKIQRAILTDLEPDPTIRQQRIAQEAERIGVKFDMQESQ